MPGYTGVHIDRALTNLSIYYRNPGFIADEVSPPVTVKKESDKYFVYDKSNFKVPQTLRADKDETQRIDFSISDDSYYCEEYGLHTLVSDRERENADEPIKPDADAVEYLTDIMLLDRETRVADEILDSSNWGSYASTHIVNLQLAWDDLAGANPRQDLYRAKFLVWKDSRKPANRIILPKEIAFRLAQMDMVDELRKYTDPGLVSDSGLPTVLWGLQVLEAEATYDGGGEAAETFYECWGNNVVVYHKHPGTIGLKTLTFAVTMQNKAFQTKKWREEKRDSDAVQITHRYDNKIVAPACGFVYTNAITNE